MLTTLSKITDPLQADTMNGSEIIWSYTTAQFLDFLGTILLGHVDYSKITI